MVEARLNFLQLHREMILGYAPIIVQHMLGERPDPFDPIDLVLGSASHETLTVIDRVMFAIAPQRLIAAKRIRVIDRPFPSGRLNMGQEGIRRHMCNNLRIDPSIPLQEPEDDTFPRSSSPPGVPSAVRRSRLHPAQSPPKAYWPCPPVPPHETTPCAPSDRPD